MDAKLTYIESIGLGLFYCVWAVFFPFFFIWHQHSVGKWRQEMRERKQRIADNAPSWDTAPEGAETLWYNETHNRYYWTPNEELPSTLADGATEAVSGRPGGAGIILRRSRTR